MSARPLHLSLPIHTLVVAQDPSDVHTLAPHRLLEPSAAIVASTAYDPLVAFRGQNVTIDIDEARALRHDANITVVIGNTLEMV